MMKIIDDDIFNCKEDIIVHQVNCQGVMGHGIAKQIKDKYIDVFDAYKAYCERGKDILGTALIVKTDDKYIANVFGQRYYGKGLQTDYNALRNGLKAVFQVAKQNNLTVAIPYKIGCGLAGGDWNIVKNIIDHIFDNATLYRLDKGEMY